MNRLTPPSHGAMPPPGHGHGLARYGSAPGSFLAAESVVTREPPAVSRFFSAESSSGLTFCESSGRTDGGGSGEIRVPPPPAQQMGPLLRHSSSPAGLLSRLMAADTHGMAATTGGTGSYSHAGADRRLSSQWSFSRQDLPQISETGTIPDGGGCNSSSASAQPYSCYLSSSRNFSVSSWDDTGSILLPSPGKKLKLDAAAADDMVFTGFSSIDSQFGLSSKSSLEMSDDYLQLQQDSIACRVRAKRGCATHPRSIAERERRTRISKRLKKLQDLVPNMDKQTCTSEMLDVAVEHIKELQGQVEKLKHDQANCTCAANQKC